MSDVFVSYKAEDRRRVKPLVDALESEGYSVWWDEQIGGGATWRHMIEAELNSAKCVVVAWSKRSVSEEGTFVQDEATRAQQRHVYVPVLIDKVHLPLGFGETQALPLSGWKGDRGDPHFQAVLAAVRRISGASKGRKSSPAPVGRHSQVDRRAVLAGGAVATVAIAGIGGWTLLRSTSAAASGTIAVLPFANLSGDPAQAYFSDGIAEELRSALARISGLKVVGRTSSEAVRNDDAATAAKKLDVANILTGSVRQSPSTIRVTAELIDGKTGMDRWSDDYDRSPGDVIKIQTDIAENVATALTAALGGTARAAASIGGTANSEAQRLIMQVKVLERGPPSKVAFQQAFELLDSAIALDPNYAEAYAAKSQALINYGNNYANGAQELAANRAEALRFAQKALELAPNLALAHFAMFGVYGSSLRMGPAYEEIKKALQLAPGDAIILARFASFTSSALGDSAKAFSLSDQAIALDPLNPGVFNQRQFMLLGARRYAEAVRYGEQLQKKFPPQFSRSVDIGDTLLMLGRTREAQSYYDQAPTDYWGRLTGEAILAARTGNTAGAKAKLGKMQQIVGDAGSYQYGEIYAQLGDAKQAFDSLNHAFEIKDGGLNQLRVDPFLDPIRSDPRFAALMTKMNFPT